MYIVSLCDDTNIDNIYRNELEFSFQTIKEAYNFIEIIIEISDYHIELTKIRGE